MERRRESMSASSPAEAEDDQRMKSFGAASPERLRMLQNSMEKEKMYTGSRVESSSSPAEKQYDQHMKSFRVANRARLRMLQNSARKEILCIESHVESGSSPAEEEDDRRMKSIVAASPEILRMQQNSTEMEKMDTESHVESGSPPAEKPDDQQMKSFCAARPERLRMLQNNTVKETVFTGSLVEPCFEDYQLIGDSLLLRFSEQLLFYKCKTDTYSGTRALGLCVSGQTVCELWRRIVSEMYPVSKKVILLIGTNDMLRGTKMDLMKRKLKYVVKELMLLAEKVIVLTLPPVPLLSHLPVHWQRLHEYNSYIKKRKKYKNVKVADITSLFLLGPERCRIDCYELFYYGARRPDRVHLNRAGLQKIQNFLLEKQLLVD